jgi:hypothetical protein
MSHPVLDRSPLLAETMELLGQQLVRDILLSVKTHPASLIKLPELKILLAARPVPIAPKLLQCQVCQERMLERGLLPATNFCQKA